MPIGQTADGKVIVHRDYWGKLTFIKQVVKVEGKRKVRTVFFPQCHPGHYDVVRQYVAENIGPNGISIRYGDGNRMLGYRLKHDKD